MAVQDTIERQMTFELPRELVWAALTEADQLGRWFGSSAELDLRAGGEGSFTWEEHGVTTRVEIVSVEPPAHFAYRWEPAGASEGGPTTLVDFRLEEIPGGTRLTLVESASRGSEPSRGRGTSSVGTPSWASSARSCSRRPRPERRARRRGGGGLRRPRRPHAARDRPPALRTGPVDPDRARGSASGHAPGGREAPRRACGRRSRRACARRAGVPLPAHARSVRGCGTLDGRARGRVGPAARSTARAAGVRGGQIQPSSLNCGKPPQYRPHATRHATVTA